MTAEAQDLRTQLAEKKKKKNHGKSKPDARLIVHPELVEMFKQDRAAREAKRAAEEEKRKEKEAQENQHAAYIVCETANRIFNALSSYKH